MSEVRGMGEAMKQAEAGMKLFAGGDDIVPDVDAATKFKEEIDAKIAALDAEAAALTGKENKKLRVDKEKAKAAIKNQHDYIDACKICKGNAPVHGHFVLSGGKPVVATKSEELVGEAKSEGKAEEVKTKAKKSQDNAGISRAERDELESLKKKIIDKKAELKEQGMSGGQINKNEEIVSSVARMNELKEKETPGSTTQGKDDKKGGKKKKLLDSESAALVGQKQAELDAYVDKLRTEFKYSKKEIAADPDYAEMKAALDKMG